MDNIQIFNISNKLLNLWGMGLRILKIGLYSPFQLLGLANIYDMAETVLHEINTGRQGKAL